MTEEQLAEVHRMASLGRLLAGVVHEVNTPAAAILSNNQVVRRSLEKLEAALGESPDAPGVSQAKQLVSALKSLAAVDQIACERIAVIVKSLKTFARVGDAELHRINLNENISSALKLLEAEFRGRIVVETHFAGLPEVECHPHLINQVFLNLLVNAGHAIDGEGKITVSTRLDGSHAVVSIADTGRGMTEEAKAKALRRGFTTKAVGVGTGLGLSIVKQIVVEGHGGTVRFQSELGKGTTFHVRIPVEQPKKGA